MASRRARERANARPWEQQGTDMETLPKIESHQTWCCSRGCGPCAPKQKDFEYSRTEDFDGNLIESLTTKVWVSGCCGSELDVYDEQRQCFVDPPERNTGDASDGCGDGDEGDEDETSDLS